MNIKITSINPTYFTPASSEVWSKDFSFLPNEKYLIKAASGSGKSSFFNFLFGLNDHYDGTILFNETAISSFTETDWTTMRREKVSIVFQGLRLFPELTAFENIQLKNQLTHHKTEAEILTYMNRLNVAELANKKAETLSYGQQQRIAIIRALCQPFELLLLDEPFSHMDDVLIANATQLITEEVTKRKATLLIASLGNSYDIEYTKTFLL